MVASPFQVLGTRVARRIGREREWNRLLSLVERNHVSVLGPKYIGKSVLLLALTEHFEANNEVFRASVYWDLRHGTPDNDVDYFAEFARRLVTPIRAINTE